MEKLNLNEMKLVFDENFDTELKEGEWENSVYTERFYPETIKFGVGKDLDGNECDKPSALVDTNISAKDGKLILTAKGKDDDTYTGSELRTKQFFNYGYFEIKAKINTSKGICPAFWLLGSRDSASKIEYEVDIFECFGRMPNIIKNTLLAHNYPYGSKGGNQGSEHRFIYKRLDEEPFPEKDMVKTFADNFNYTFFKGNWGEEFHTFGLDWKPDSITWYIDGKPMLTSTPSEVFDGKYIYDEPMFVILTCYSGRDVCSPLTGFPDETTDWENGNRIEIDYLKVWQY